MSSKRERKQKKEEEFEVKPPLMQRPGFNRIYSIIVIVLFAIAIILIILSYIESLSLGWLLFIALGILGVAVILLTMRSSYKSSAPEEAEEKEEDSDSLQMRNR